MLFTCMFSDLYPLKAKVLFVETRSVMKRLNQRIEQIVRESVITGAELASEAYMEAITK